MKLSNEFVVAAPIERTWATLLAAPPDGWRGTIGEYAGTARLEDIDDDERVASFRAVTSDGAAAATLTSRLMPADGGTRVLVETDLRATGGVDRPRVEEALEQLSERLEREALGEAPRPAVAAGEAEPDRTALVAAAALLALLIALVLRGRRR
jgi:hypothetical protein